MQREAIVLAGGYGTRLKEVVSELPKSMAPVNDRPFLTYLMDYLLHFKVDKINFSVGYKAEAISKYFGASYKGTPISYILEEEPLGTGGGIKKALQETQEEAILVLNGDTIFDVDLDKYYQFHTENNSAYSLALKPMQNFDRYGTVELGADNAIKGFKEKTFVEKGLINGGMYLINKSAFFAISTPDKFSIEKDFMEKYIDQVKFKGFVSEGYFRDIGIPSDYQKAQDEFKKLKY